MSSAPAVKGTGYDSPAEVGGGHPTATVADGERPWRAQRQDRTPVWGAQTGKEERKDYTGLSGAGREPAGDRMLRAGL